MLAGSIYQTENQKPLTLPLRWAIRLPLTLLERSRITDHYIT